MPPLPGLMCRLRRQYLSAIGTNPSRIEHVKSEIHIVNRIIPNLSLIHRRAQVPIEKSKCSLAVDRVAAVEELDLGFFAQANLAAKS